MFATSPCKRCWRCCITAGTMFDYRYTILRQHQRFEWLKTRYVTICPLLGVNDEGQPHCLIYEDRPRICREYRCESMGKQPRIMKCSLCGRRYAALNSTFQVTPYYRLKFCDTCTQILLNMIRKTKVALAIER